MTVKKLRNRAKQLENERHFIIQSYADVKKEAECWFCKSKGQNFIEISHKEGCYFRKILELVYDMAHVNI